MWKSWDYLRLTPYSSMFPKLEGSRLFYLWIYQAKKHLLIYLGKILLIYEKSYNLSKIFRRTINAVIFGSGFFLLPKTWKKLWSLLWMKCFWNGKVKNLIFCMKQNGWLFHTTINHLILITGDDYQIILCNHTYTLFVTLIFLKIFKVFCLCFFVYQVF